MNRSDESLFDARIAGWLEDDPYTAPDQALEIVLAAFPSIKQRRPLRAPWRFPEMTPSKLGLAAVAVAVVVGGLFLFGPWLGPIPDSGAPATASPSVDPSAVVATSSPTLPPVTGLPGTLAFRIEEGTRKHVALMQPDRTGRVQLTADAKPDSGPIVSPDGSRVIFERTDPVGNAEIWVVNADGSGEFAITQTAEYEDWPSWSADGTKAVFTRAYTENGRTYSEIVIRAVTPTAQLEPPESDTVVIRRDIAAGTFVDFKPAWSPDGSKIAFTSNMDGPYRLYTINPDGSGLARVADEPASGRPAWSPDSSTIAYSENRSDGCIWVIGVTGEGSRAIAGDQCTDGPVAWSPDGTMVAWAGGWVPAPISVVGVDGSNLRQLTADGVYGDLSWGPTVR
jgi:Tol biopolymer transport system component